MRKERVKKINTILQKNTFIFRTLACILLSSIVVLLIGFFWRISYAISDDYCMSDIAGYYQNSDLGEYLVFNNIILGKIVRALYGINNQLNWYGVLMIVLVVVCFSILMYILWDKSGRVISIIPIVLIEIVVVVNITFTIIAFVLTATAILFFTVIISNSINKSKTNLFLKFLLFICLLLLGNMYRMESFLVTIIVMIPICIYANNKKSKQVLIMLAISVVLLAGINMYNRYEYHQGQWKDYSEWLNARSIVDYKKIDYKKNEDKIKEIGFSKNDIDSFYAWVFGDKEVFSVKNLKSLNEIIPINEKYNLDVISVVKQLITKKTIWLIIILGVVIGILVGKREKKYNFIILLVTLTLFASLVVRQRCVERVFIPIFVIGMLSIYFLLLNTSHKKINIGIIVVSILLCLYTAKIGYEKYDEFQNTIDCGKVQEYIANNTENLYVADLTECYYIKGIKRSVFQIAPKNNNLIAYGEWDMFNERYYRIAKKYNIKNKNNVLLSLAESKNIYVVETKFFPQSRVIECLDKYIEEHTNKQLKKKVIKSFPDCKISIYKYSIQ